MTEKKKRIALFNLTRDLIYNVCHFLSTQECCFLNSTSKLFHIAVNEFMFMHIQFNNISLNIKCFHHAEYFQKIRKIKIELPLFSQNQLLFELSTSDKFCSLQNLLLVDRSRGNLFLPTIFLSSVLKTLHICLHDSLHPRKNLKIFNLSCFSKLEVLHINGQYQFDVLPDNLLTVCLTNIPTTLKKLPSSLRELRITENFNLQNSQNKLVIPPNVQVLQYCTPEFEFEDIKEIKHLQMTNAACFLNQINNLQALNILSLDFSGKFLPLPMCWSGTPNLNKLSLRNFRMSYDVACQELPHSIEYLDWRSFQDNLQLENTFQLILDQHPNIRYLACGPKRAPALLGLPKKSFLPKLQFIFERSICEIPFFAIERHSFITSNLVNVCFSSFQEPSIFTNALKTKLTSNILALTPFSIDVFPYNQQVYQFENKNYSFITLSDSTSIKKVLASWLKIMGLYS